MTGLGGYPALGGKLGGAFYLHGGEHFRKEEALRALIDTHLDPATGAFNLDPLRGTEVDAETLASVLATPPMMAEWRVVVLREVEGLAGSKKARDELLAVVEAPPPGLALIMSCTVPSGSKAKFYQQLTRAARSVEFKAIDGADLPGWLMAQARDRHGIELDDDAARALGGALGGNLGALAQELHKLAGFVGDRSRITMSDVDAAGTSLPSQDRWQWFDLVGERRLEEARASLGVLLAQGETGVGLVIGLAQHLLRIGVAAEDGSKALEEQLPTYQRWLARRIAPQARRWPAPALDHALAGLLDVDRLLKASPQGAERLLESWLLDLMVQQEAA